MKYYVLMDRTGYISGSFSLKRLFAEVDLSEQEVDHISSLMVGDTYALEYNHDKYLAVRRVQS